MKAQIATIIVIVIVAVALAACSSSSETRPGSDQAKLEQAQAAKATTAQSGSQQPEKWNQRRLKDLQDADAKELGTLADGVGVPVGDQAPNATVEDIGGRPIELSSLWSERPLVLVFYRGGWCPYCNSQIRRLTKTNADFDKRGVGIAVISVDSVEESNRTKKTYEVPFPILSDPDLKAHEAFRVVHKIDDATADKYKGFGIDLDKASGRSHHKIAVPSIFIVDQGGTVRWAHGGPDYKVRPSPAQLLAGLDKMPELRAKQ